MSLFFKFKVWNIYLLTLLSYVDHCYIQPPNVTTDVMEMLQDFRSSWVG